MEVVFDSGPAEHKGNMNDPAPRVIRTPDQRLRVFVSSTLQEMVDERKAARQAIERLRLTPVMFELGARPHPPKELYRAYLDQSDIFIGIYWQKYGWVAPDMNISGLEDEWRLSGDKPKLIYIKAPAPNREARLKELLDRIRNDDRVSYKPFSTPDELCELIGNDLALMLTERFELSTGQSPPTGMPTGTVTFLFTDIEGSTELFQKHPDAMKDALARHHAILQQAITAHDGYVFQIVGDAFYAAFHTASDGLAAALAAQRALRDEPWTETGPIRVRMGLHSGTAQVRVEDVETGQYSGYSTLARTQRIMSSGHGGQVLLSGAIAELVRSQLPEAGTLRDLGEHRLKGLTSPEHLWQLSVPDLPQNFPQLKTLGAHPNNLPIQLTSFIGREKEIAQIKDGTTTHRLLTLVGPGGTGKTRLAVQAALDLLDQFKDGVFFVNLAPISDPSLVASTIATALDVRETVGSRPLIETLKDYLRHKQLLLLLDNFEQVVSAAPVVTELLETCPRLKILVTSRTPLHVRGEKEQPVPTLALPDRKSLPDVERLRQYAAVELFIQRVLDVKPDFTITPESLLAIAEICTRLDGLPLAIELAAARIKILSPQMMLARLEHRLPLLTEGARDLPARQQTLRSAIDWSYDLLDESARTLFRRLSVFVGGWTLEAAEAVCKSGDDLGIDVLDGLASLVDNSLLTQIEEPSGEPRFRMLETIREYALERLAASPREGEAMRQRHAEYHLALAEVAEDKLRSAERVAWLDRLEGEHDNLRAALEWSTVKNDRTEIGLRIAGALLWFWHTRGYATEGRGWLKRLVTLNGVVSGTTARAKALYGAGELAWAQGDYPAARPLLEEGLVVGRAAGDWRSVAYALAFLGMVVITQGDVATARSLYQESIALLREVGDKWGEAFTLNWTADALLAGGDLPTARSFYEQSLTLWRATGDPWGSSLPLMALGGIALSQADYAAAQACFEESVALSRSIGDRWGLSWVLSGLGNLALRRGDLGRAKAIFEESLTLGRDMGNPIGIIVCFGGIARLAAAQGDTVRAARLIGAAEALRESLNAYPWHATRLAYEQNVADARAQLDEEAYAAAWAEGRAMKIEEAIEYALKEA